MQSELKLKPCPFCGSTDVELDVGNFVQCNGCFLMTHGPERWNRRAGSDAVPPGEVVAWKDVRNELAVAMVGLLLNQQANTATGADFERLLDRLADEGRGAIHKLKHSAPAPAQSAGSDAVPPGYKLVPIEAIVSLFQLIDPPPIEVNGKLMVFKNPNAAEMLTRISAEVRSLVEAPAPEPISYALGEWFEAKTVDEMQAFYRERLPAIREAAREHGYAIGLHGSTRRDLDLMAMQWRDDASDLNTLAHAIAMAACGIARDSGYFWEQKPHGRMATSIPICWTAWHDMVGAGHIDLSVIDPLLAAATAPAPETADKPERGELPELLEELFALIEGAPELNMSNYNDDDVSELNASIIEIYQVAQKVKAALSATKPAPVDEEAERERFHLWVKSKGGSVIRRDGSYIESMTRLWWMCWQARAALATAGGDDPVGWMQLNKYTPPTFTYLKTMADQAAKDGKPLIPLYTRPDSSRLAEALRKIAGTNASKHGTISMMLERCTGIARQALAQYEGKDG